MKYLYSGLCALLAVGLFFVTWWSTKNSYLDKEDQKACSSYVDTKSSPMVCGIWSDGECRKGVVQGMSCVSEGSYLPLASMVGGAVLLIVSGYLAYSAYSK